MKKKYEAIIHRASEKLSRYPLVYPGSVFKVSVGSLVYAGHKYIPDNDFWFAKRYANKSEIELAAAILGCRLYFRDVSIEPLSKVLEQHTNVTLYYDLLRCYFLCRGDDVFYMGLFGSVAKIPDPSVIDWGYTDDHSLLYGIFLDRTIDLSYCDYFDSDKTFTSLLKEYGCHLGGNLYSILDIVFDVQSIRPWLLGIDL